LQWNDKAISQEKIHRDSIGDFNEVWNEQEKTGSDLKKRLIDYAAQGLVNISTTSITNSCQYKVKIRDEQPNFVLMLFNVTSRLIMSFLFPRF